MLRGNETRWLIHSLLSPSAVSVRFHTEVRNLKTDSFTRDSKCFCSSISCPMKSYLGLYNSVFHLSLLCSSLPQAPGPVECQDSGCPARHQEVHCVHRGFHHVHCHLEHTNVSVVVSMIAVKGLHGNRRSLPWSGHIKLSHC